MKGVEERRILLIEGGLERGKTECLGEILRSKEGIKVGMMIVLGLRSTLPSALGLTLRSE